MYMRKYIQAGMAIILLISTMGVGIGRHFCQEDLKDFSLFENPTVCCPVSTETGISSGCCKVDFQFLQVEDEFASTTHDLLLPLLVLDQFLPERLSLGLNPSKVPDILSKPVPPPLLFRKSPAFLSTFLI